MNTPTHLALAVAVLGRHNHPKDTKWVICGALMPDLPMFVLFALDRLRGYGVEEIFRSRYFQPEWQIPLSITNSLPLYALIALLAYGFKSRAVAVFALAAILHILCDIPLHNTDAHAHFWPLSDWKYFSPLSYWDNDYHAQIVAPLEMLLLLFCGFYGMRVFVHKWAKYLFLGFCLISPLAFFSYQIYEYFLA